MITGEDIQNLRLPLVRPSGDVSVYEIAARLVNVLLIVAGIIAFIYLIYAGILYITSGNNPDQAKKAQGAVINIIIGVIVITLAYAIVRFAASLARQVGF